MSDEERIHCGIDWIDGACRRSATAGTPGWEQRESINGDQFYVCPDHARKETL